MFFRKSSNFRQPRSFGGCAIKASRFAKEKLKFTFELIDSITVCWCPLQLCEVKVVVSKLHRTTVSRSVRPHLCFTKENLHLCFQSCDSCWFCMSQGGRILCKTMVLSSRRLKSIELTAFLLQYQSVNAWSIATPLSTGGYESLAKTVALHQPPDCDFSCPKTLRWQIQCKNCVF